MFPSFKKKKHQYRIRVPGDRIQTDIRKKIAKLNLEFGCSETEFST